MSFLTSCPRVPGATPSKRPPRAGRFVSLSLCALLLFAATVGVVGRRAARAQEKSGSGAKSADDKTSKQAQALFEQLDDIDMMRSLNPLKLKPEQIDKLVTAVTDAKTDYDKQIADLTAVSGPAQIIKMADDIKSQHKDALSGKPTPKAFDDRIQKIQTDFLAERDKINAKNILRMSEAVHKILSDDQTKAAVELEKSTLVALKRYTPTTTDGQLLNLYVVDVFIGYPRIVTLLKEIKETKAP